MRGGNKAQIHVLDFGVRVGDVAGVLVLEVDLPATRSLAGRDGSIGRRGELTGEAFPYRIAMLAGKLAR